MNNKLGRPASEQKLVSMTALVTQRQKNYVARHGNISVETRAIIQNNMDSKFTKAQQAFIDSFPGKTFFEKIQALVDVAMDEDKGVNHD